MEIPIHVEWIVNFLIDQLHAFTSKNKFSREIRPEVYSILSEHRSLLYSSSKEKILEPYIYSLAIFAIDQSYSLQSSTFHTIELFLQESLYRVRFSADKLKVININNIEEYDILASDIMLLYLKSTLKSTKIYQEITNTDYNSYETAFEKWTRTITGNSSQFRSDFIYDICTSQSTSLILSKVRPDLVRMDHISFGSSLSIQEITQNWTEIEVALIVLGIRKPNASEQGDKLCIICFLADLYLAVTPILNSKEENIFSIQKVNVPTTFLPKINNDTTTQYQPSSYSYLQKIDSLLDKINELADPVLHEMKQRQKALTPLFKPVSIMAPSVQPPLTIYDNKPSFYDQNKPIEQPSVQKDKFETELQIIRPNPKHQNFSKNKKVNKIARNNESDESDSSLLEAEKIPQKIVNAQLRKNLDASYMKEKKRKQLDSIPISEQRLIFKKVKDHLNRKSDIEEDSDSQMSPNRLQRSSKKYSPYRMAKPQNESELYSNFQLAEQVKQRQKIQSKKQDQSISQPNSPNRQLKRSSRKAKDRNYDYDYEYEDEENSSSFTPPRRNDHRHRNNNDKQQKNRRNLFNEEDDIRRQKPPIYNEKSNKSKNRNQSKMTIDNPKDLPKKEKLKSKKYQEVYGDDDDNEYDDLQMHQHKIKNHKIQKQEDYSSQNSSDLSISNNKSHSPQKDRKKNDGSYYENYQRRKQLLEKDQQREQNQKKLKNKEKQNKSDLITKPQKADNSPLRSKVSTKNEPQKKPKKSALQNFINEKEQDSIQRKHLLYQGMVPNLDDEIPVSQNSNLIPIDESKSKNDKKNPKFQSLLESSSILKSDESNSVINDSEFIDKRKFKSGTNKLDGSSSLKSFLEIERQLKENQSSFSTTIKTENSYVENFEEEEEDSTSFQIENENENIYVEHFHRQEDNEEEEEEIPSSSEIRQNKYAQEFTDEEGGNSKSSANLEDSLQKPKRNHHQKKNESYISEYDINSLKMNDKIESSSKMPSDAAINESSIFSKSEEINSFSIPNDKGKRSSHKNSMNESKHDKANDSSKLSKSQKQRNSNGSSVLEDSSKEKKKKPSQESEEKNSKIKDELDKLDFLPTFRSSDSDSFEDPLIALGKVGLSSSELLNENMKPNNKNKAKSNENNSNSANDEPQKETVKDESQEDIKVDISLASDNENKFSSNFNSSAEEEEEDINKDYSNKNEYESKIYSDESETDENKKSSSKANSANNKKSSELDSKKNKEDGKNKQNKTSSKTKSTNSDNEEEKVLSSNDQDDTKKDQDEVSVTYTYSYSYSYSNSNSNSNLQEHDKSEFSPESNVNTNSEHQPNASSHSAHQSDASLHSEHQSNASSHSAHQSEASLHSEHQLNASSHSEHQSEASLHSGHQSSASSRSNSNDNLSSQPSSSPSVNEDKQKVHQQEFTENSDINTVTEEADPLESDSQKDEKEQSLLHSDSDDENAEKEESNKIQLIKDDDDDDAIFSLMDSVKTSSDDEERNNNDNHDSNKSDINDLNKPHNLSEFTQSEKPEDKANNSYSYAHSNESDAKSVESNEHPKSHNSQKAKDNESDDVIISSSGSSNSLKKDKSKKAKSHSDTSDNEAEKSQNQSDVFDTEKSQDQLEIVDDSKTKDQSEADNKSQNLSDIVDIESEKSQEHSKIIDIAKSESTNNDNKSQNMSDVFDIESEKSLEHLEIVNDDNDDDKFHNFSEFTHSENEKSQNLSEIVDIETEKSQIQSEKSGNEDEKPQNESEIKPKKSQLQPEDDKSHDLSELIHSETEKSQNQSESSDDETEKPRNQSEKIKNEDGKSHNLSEFTQNETDKSQSQSEAIKDEDGKSHNLSEFTQNESDKSQQQSESSENERKKPQSQSEATKDEDGKLHDSSEFTQNETEKSQNQSESSNDENEKPQNQSKTTKNEDDRSHNLSEFTQNETEKSQNQSESSDNESKKPHHDQLEKADSEKSEGQIDIIEDGNENKENQVDDIIMVTFSDSSNDEKSNMNEIIDDIVEEEEEADEDEIIKKEEKTHKEEFSSPNLSLSLSSSQLKKTEELQSSPENKENQQKSEENKKEEDDFIDDFDGIDVDVDIDADADVDVDAEKEEKQSKALSSDSDQNMNLSLSSSSSKDEIDITKDTETPTVILTKVPIEDASDQKEAPKSTSHSSDNQEENSKLNSSDNHEEKPEHQSSDNHEDSMLHLSNNHAISQFTPDSDNSHESEKSKVDNGSIQLSINSNAHTVDDEASQSHSNQKGNQDSQKLNKTESPIKSNRLLSSSLVNANKAQNAQSLDSNLNKEKKNSSSIEPIDFGDEFLLHQNSIFDMTPTKTIPAEESKTTPVNQSPRNSVNKYQTAPVNQSQELSIIRSQTAIHSTLRNENEISAIEPKSPTLNKAKNNSVINGSSDSLIFSDDEQNANDDDDEKNNLSKLDSFADQDDIFNSVVTLPTDSVSNSYSKHSIDQKSEAEKESKNEKILNDLDMSDLSLGTQNLPSFNEDTEKEGNEYKKEKTKHGQSSNKAELSDMSIKTDNLPQFEDSNEIDLLKSDKEKKQETQKIEKSNDISLIDTTNLPKFESDDDDDDQDILISGEIVLPHDEDDIKSSPKSHEKDDESSSLNFTDDGQANSPAQKSTPNSNHSTPNETKNSNSVSFTQSATTTQVPNHHVSSPIFIESSKIQFKIPQFDAKKQQEKLIQQQQQQNALSTPTASTNVIDSTEKQSTPNSQYPHQIHSPVTTQRVTFDKSLVKASRKDHLNQPIQQLPPFQLVVQSSSSSSSASNPSKEKIQLTHEQKEMINEYLKESKGQNKSKYQNLSTKEEKVLLQILPRVTQISQQELYDYIANELNVRRTDQVCHKIVANITTFLGHGESNNDPLSKTSAVHVLSSSVNEEEDDDSDYF